MPQQSETCPLEKKKTQWLQCFEIKRHHTEDIAVVNSQLEKHQQVWEKEISHFVTSLFKNMQCSQKSKGILFYFISFPEKRSYSYWVMHFILYLKIADKHWNVCRHLHNMLNTVLCTAMSFVIWTTPFYFYFFLVFHLFFWHFTTTWKLLWNRSIYFLKLIQFIVMGVLDPITVFIGKEAGSPGQVTNLSQGNHPYLWPI